jgi:hypothetical protein
MEDEAIWNFPKTSSRQHQRHVKAMSPNIILSIPPIHATALAGHLLLVLKNYVEGKPASSIPQEQFHLLSDLDQAYQKLDALSDYQDDETPQHLQLSAAEATALVQAFRDETLREAAQSDEFYQRHDYEAYYHGIYSKYLTKLEGQ